MGGVRVATSEGADGAAGGVLEPLEEEVAVHAGLEGGVAPRPSVQTHGGAEGGGASGREEGRGQMYTEGSTSRRFWSDSICRNRLPAGRPFLSPRNAEWRAQPPPLSDDRRSVAEGTQPPTHDIYANHSIFPGSDNETPFAIHQHSSVLWGVPCGDGREGGGGGEEVPPGKMPGETPLAGWEGPRSPALS